MTFPSLLAEFIVQAESQTGGFVGKHDPLRRMLLCQCLQLPHHHSSRDRIVRILLEHRSTRTHAHLQYQTVVVQITAHQNNLCHGQSSERVENNFVTKLNSTASQLAFPS